jgi:beta-glucosidase
MNLHLPDDFVWGVATSAYQIEGGRYQGGKGESIWDRFADEGRMSESGDVACDHYHRWREDVGLMKDLGVDAYRFSLAWTRIVPEGIGPVSEEGLAFYSDLIDELLAAGITPWATLYHWDLPQALQDRGGWANRDTAEAFAAFAAAASSMLGDRVDHWITHNEPWVATVAGHVEGIFAPGIRDWAVALPAAHHILLSHGRAIQEIRRNVPGATVGIALDCRPARPASDEPADAAAARHFDGFRNRWFFDPVFGMGYPEDMVEAYHRLGRLDAPALPFVESGDLDVIAEPVDFLGLNYYTSLDIAAGFEESEDTGVPQSASPSAGYTEMGWPITPAALTDYLLHLNETYDPPSIVITENGASYSDGPGSDGAVHDARRIDYLDAHIAAVAAARDAGAPVIGYFAWSLLDNLEWTSGYAQRFGLVWVDHATGERIPKDSFRWYRDVVRPRQASDD